MGLPKLTVLIVIALLTQYQHVHMGLTELVVLVVRAARGEAGWGGGHLLGLRRQQAQWVPTQTRAPCMVRYTNVRCDSSSSLYN